MTHDVGEEVAQTAEYEVCAARIRRLEGPTDMEGRFPGCDYRDAGPPRRRGL